ncbi:MAG: hypothetical protein JOZ73_04250 [Solirubrobacterales bacterium]|nr:hypothetical protein [Solirubrobacterales bacterium]
MTVRSGAGAAARVGLSCGLAVRDAALNTIVDGRAPPREPRGTALDSAIDWLCLSHEVTGRQGSSKGFSLLRGWLGAYPETTGYVIGTLLHYGERTGRSLLDRALEMARWEAEVQQPDGGVMQGTIDEDNRRSIVFNTGMVLHGWVDMIERGHEQFVASAGRAAEFLTREMGPDGTWNTRAEYSAIPHAYNSRVAWAMLRFAALTGDEQVREAATSQLDWTVRAQRPNGWFDHCFFKPGMLPSTHAIAYTLRGLLESSEIAADERYLEAVIRTSEVLIRKLEVTGLPGVWDEEWRPRASYECLTGVVQLGGVWLRLYQLRGDARFLSAGLKAIDRGARRQERAPHAAIRGALAGSFPIFGGYAPLQYPNWATKFLADALMLREDCLAELEDSRSQPDVIGTPAR